MSTKFSTKRRNDSGTISELGHEAQEPNYITKNGEGDLVGMNIDVFESRAETFKLRTKLEAAEQSRLAGEPTFTVEESRARLQSRLMNAE